jgi:protein-L-isoaspartate(D-aspartate) O-methyltransferase
MEATAFSRFPIWMWRNSEVRAFVDWLRSYNTAHKPTSRVAFHGLDLYSQYDSIRFVLEYLDDVDPKSAKVARERYGCLTPWQSDPAIYGHAALTGKFPTCEADVAHALSDLLKKHQAYDTFGLMHLRFAIFSSCLNAPATNCIGAVQRT